MCDTCNQLTEQGNEALNELIDARCTEPVYDDEQYARTRPEMLTANAIRDTLPRAHRNSVDVATLCLTLAVAVERLALLEKQITT